MIDIETARQMALSLPGAYEQDHFGIPSFRVNDRIFSTLWIPEKRMMVKLPLPDQDIFSLFNKNIIYPVPNKFGLKGCTFFELETVPHEMLEDALQISWNTIISKTKKKSR
jgi:predicted DNA-binding protein (MmcQ/YjbR family)